MKLAMMLFISLLISQNTIADAINGAIMVNNEQKIMNFIKKGIDVNKINQDGNWPLLVAATYGSVNAAKILVENGANVNKSNNHGYTALHEAASMADRKMVLFLLKHDAEINKRDINQYTALTYANLSGSAKLVRMLKRKGGIE